MAIKIMITSAKQLVRIKIFFKNIFLLEIFFLFTKYILHLSILLFSFGSRLCYGTLIFYLMMN